MFEVKELNAETGEEIIRPATAEEIAQIEADQAAAQATEEAKQSALDKLKALGLELSDLEALGLV